MTTSTDAHICYGILLGEPEYIELPWENGDIDEWYRDVQGYQPPFMIFDERGEYINGVTPEQSKISEYFAHRRKFDKAYPCPVCLVNAQHIDVPMWILAAPNKV